jgi:serine phosphatase RsbU (regulator of sigma subunit)
VAVVTLLDPDGAQRLVGAYGLQGEIRSQWSRIPPDPALPVVVAVRDLEQICLTDPDSILQRFPMYADLPFPGEGLFVAPLVSGGRVLGALGLSWNQPLPDDDEWRRYLAALVGPVARSVDALIGEEIAHAWVHTASGEAAGGGAPAQVWLPTVIDALHNPAALLSPVIEDGQLVDFRVEYSNALARRLITGAHADPGDATLLAIYPVLGSTTLLSAFGQLLQDGEPRRLYGLRGDAPGGGRAGSLDVHAVRLWDRVFTVWRVHTAADLLYDQMLRAERIAQIGSFCWDLRTHEPQYSPELVRLYYANEEQPPGAELPLADLTSCVHPDDLLAVQDAIRRTVVEGKHLLAEFRGASRLAGRRLRLAGEPVLEGGTVIMVRGIVQDVTEERAIEARLRLAEEALAAQRRRTTDERRAAEALQEALLPTQPELAQTEGVFICGRCRSVEKVGTVDGDWYDAAALAGGATMLVLGDVDDSGLSSMTTAARLRYAVRAYAMLDMAPGEILGAVNSMLYAMEVEHTAMLVVARYDPATRELRWAAAGQVAPIRYAADGRGSILSGPLGLPLGAAPDVRYSDTTVVLNPGERVLLFTDGLVRADRRKSGGLEIVRRASEHVDLDDLGAIVEHITSSVGAREDEDLCALLIRID